MSTRDFSLIQEKNVAKLLNGHRTPNSGATSFIKGDVLLDNMIIECKTKVTPCKSFSVSKDWLDKLEEERIEMGKCGSALAISYDCGATSYYVIDQRMMKILVEALIDE